MFKIYRKFTGLIFASAFIVVMLFGLNMGMDTRQDGTMSGCALDQSTTCPMNYQEHINDWQQTLTATQPTQNTILAFLIIIVTLGGAALLFHSLLNWQRRSQEIHSTLQAVRRQRDITAKLSNHILQALSNGILNPKLYIFSNATR